jgi:long-chain fatty acid transport protein
MKNVTNAGLALGLVVAFASQASAAGYEKSIMWGGKTGSVAGISTSYIEGADSLYFNPAGLVQKAPGQDLSFNISPVASKFSGPYNNNNDVETSATNIAVPLSLIYSNTLNDQWAFGVGGFISGGSKVTYDNINYPDAVSNPSTKTDLQIAELSVGGAWKPLPAWKFGVSYRYVMAQANFAFFQRAFVPAGQAGAGTYLGIVNASLNDLKDQESAFKLGAQWELNEKTHMGLTYRSEVPINATGNISGDFYKKSGGLVPSGAITGTSASAATVFPQAITLGADHNFTDVWQGLCEIAWTNYSRVDSISTGVHTTAGGGGTIKIDNPSIIQQWKDQWNLRLGGNFMGWDWPLRFGYGLTTQVTDSAWARPTFTPPGLSHTLTVGSGHRFVLGGQKLDFNGAGEYTFVSGSGTGHAAGDNAPSTTTDIRSGDFATSSFALHLGLAYNF